MNEKITIIGAGLSGCEIALRLANKGYKVVLYNKHPNRQELYRGNNMAQLVCSNSLGNKSINHPQGLLIKELELLSSQLLKIAYENSYSSETKLFVNRNAFSAQVTQAIKSHRNITVKENLIQKIPKTRPLVIATGPLTNDFLVKSIKNLFGQNSLSFYDATSPIVNKKSVDLSKCWFDTKNPNIYNISLNRKEYFQLVNELKSNCSAETLRIKESTNFDQCLPVELIATIHSEELAKTRFASKREKDFATIEMLQDYSVADGLVINGFITRLPYPTQKAILQKFPCLNNVSFIRYGRMHENSFVNAPKLLNNFFECKNHEDLYIIGQLSGIDGYLPAVASAIVAEYSIDCKFIGIMPIPFPTTTMIGGFAKYSSTKNQDYQPMTSSLGLLSSTKDHYNISILSLEEWKR
ncbi:methylenetetrahydrofolate--tRNA-(uracil-5-)-methyltransferase TrmFO [Bacteroidia bacterium]|nr:methylenetetrahydrofolate--tRNA-(uracil-5-)-methyltransferase TrmFO [Bacteroidia bacterium]